MAPLNSTTHRHKDLIINKQKTTESEVEETNLHQGFFFPNIVLLRKMYLKLSSKKTNVTDSI